MWAGVCGGIGEYFNVDPTVVRIGIVLLAVMTGGLPIFAAYIIAMLIIPENPIV